MNQKYKATGIILKGSSLKENDRLVTVLTPEYGLIRAVAPGAKKHKSSLRGRTELFVINDLLLVKGRSLDKIIQADTLYTYPGLSRDLGKLAAAQYLGELALFLAVDEQPQKDLYIVFNEHLKRLEAIDVHKLVYPYLAQAVFHLVAIAGLAPQVFNCCQTQQPVTPELNSSKWQVGFSFEGGGVIDLARVTAKRNNNQHLPEFEQPLPKINYLINPSELAILQQLNHETLPTTKSLSTQTTDIDFDAVWIRIEKILREYIQYHIGKTIYSATLVDSLYVEF